MHIKRIKQQMRLMSPPLPQTLKLRLIQIILQNRPILRMRRLLHNDPGPLARTQPPHIRQPLLRHNNIQIMLRLVDVGAHGHDTAHARGIPARLARPRAGRVHDAVLAAPQEIRGPAEPVQHARAHDTGAVGVRVDVDFHGRVHPDDAQPADDLGRVGDGLRAQQQLGVVRVPVVVEAAEPVRREADAGRRGEVEVAAVEEVEEGVLQHLGPDFEVFEVRPARSEAADDGVGDVADAGLDREEVGREAAVVDFVFEEFDEVGGDGAGGVVFRGIWLRLVGVV